MMDSTPPALWLPARPAIARSAVDLDRDGVQIDWRLRGERLKVLQALFLPGFIGCPLTVRETLTITLNADNDDGSITKRQWFSQALFSSVGGRFVRLTFEAPASGTYKWEVAYVAHAAAAGDAYDFNATPSQITVAAATFWEISNGAQLVSDIILMPSSIFDETKNLIVSSCAATSAKTTVRRNAGLSGSYARYYKAGVNDASTVNATGYSTDSGYCEGIRKVEVIG